MPSELKSKVADAVKDAMRAKDKARLGVLRMIMAEFKRVEVDERIELDDSRVLAILDKQLKQRKDSAAQFSAAGRDDLAATENFEISVIATFMPRALGAEEIEQLLRQAIEDTGAQTMRDMGKVMALVKPKVQGRADMTEVSRQVKFLLS